MGTSESLAEWGAMLARAAGKDGQGVGGRARMPGLAELWALASRGAQAAAGPAPAPPPSPAPLSWHRPKCA